jgi:ATP-dependent RNA helicase RhlE
VDVLVATPGRLLDLLEQRAMISKIKILVLDEVDRMLDMVFCRRASDR